MANDFSAILEIIAEIVIFIIKRTIDLICIVIYLISFCLPWRIFEELFSEHDSDWRCSAIISLFLTIFDFIAIPLGIISTISPLRWKQISKSLKNYSKHNLWELRLDLIYSFFCSILDIIAFICFLIQHFFIFRIHLVYHSLTKTRSDDYVDSVIDAELEIIKLTFSSFIDCLFFLPGLIFTLLVPSLWHCTYYGIKDTLTPMPNIDHIYQWDDSYWNIRLILISRVPYAIYDIICFPMAIFALLSPFRNTAFRLALFEHGIETCSFGIQEYIMEDILPYNDNNLVPEVQVTIIPDNNIPSAPPILSSSPPNQLTNLEQYEQQQVEQQQELENEEKLQIENLSIAQIQQYRRVEIPSEYVSLDEYKTNNEKIQNISNNNNNNNQIIQQSTTIEPIETTINLPSAPSKSIEQSKPNNNQQYELNQQRPLAITTAIKSKPKYNQVYYNTLLRYDCIYFGITAFVDLILLPILLPLVITWYRYAPIKDDLFTTNNLSSSTSTPTSQRKRLPKPWGFKEYGIISRQFCFLLLDLIFSPLLLLTYLTQYRWIPISIVRDNDDLISYRSIQVYSTLLWTLFIMVIDIITLPFALIVIITWYRSESIRIAFNNKRILFGLNSLQSTYCGGQDIDECCLVNFSVFFIHCAILGNFIIIIHDFFIAPFLFLIGFLSGVRTYRTISIISSSFNTQCLKKQTNNNNNNSNNNNDNPTAPPLSDIEQSTPQSLQPISSNVPIHYSLMTDISNPPPNDILPNHPIDFTTSVKYPDIFPSSTWRIHLYFEAINSLLDLPFVIIALFVMLTLWRCRSLLNNLKKIENESSTTYYRYYSRKDSDEIDCWCCDCCCCCCYGIDVNWRRRKEVILELSLLIRDFLMLIPLFILFGTLYKIPGLILDLIGRCYPINRNIPILKPSKCKIIVPENTGPIYIQINCDLNDNNIDNNNDNDNNLKFTGPVKLFVEGTTLWNEVTRIFGDSITKIGKSMLPLKLKEGDGVANGIITLLSQQEITNLDNNNNNQNDINNSKYYVWIKLDLGSSAKRTTILKKLNLLNQSTPIAIQLEAKSISNLSPVIISIIPTIQDLIKIFNNETQYLPESTFDRDGTIRQNILSLTPISNGLVDEFWIIILLHFSEFLLDIIHLLIVIFICMIPWRIPYLIFSLFESSIKSTWRELKELYLRYQDSQQCLLDYKSNMLPLANSLAKSIKPNNNYGTYDDFILYFNDYDYYSYYRYSYHYNSRRYYNPLHYYSVNQIHHRLKILEDITLKRYEKDSEKIIHKTNKGNEKIQQFGQLLLNHKEIQMMRLTLWGFRFAAGMMNENEVLQLCNYLKIQYDLNNENNFHLVSLLSEIISNFDSDIRIKEMKLQSQIDLYLNDIKKQVDKENNELSFKKRWNGLFIRSINETRKIIRDIGYQAIRDIGFIIIFIGLLITIVRTLPLLKDLYTSNSYSITSSITQRILLKHFRGAAQDTKRFFTFLFYTFIVFILGVGIPSFLTELPKRLKSLEDATECAKEHIKETALFLCELLGLFTAWKTYKLTITAGLYAVLVPPACIAEAIPRRLSSVQFRFIFGIIVWLSLIIGAIILSIRTHDNNNNNGNDKNVRNSFLGFYGSLIGVIIFSSWSLSHRIEYTNPIKESSTGFLIPSWSHIISILLGPIESIQLTSVVLYFFWNGSQSYISSNGGSFTFPIVFLFDSNTINSYGYSLAIGLTSVCIFIWIIIVSIPLIYDDNDNNYNNYNNNNKRKIKNFQENPAFNFIYTLFSRIIFVSIIATLLRPYSCIVNNIDNKLYMSTNINQICGGNNTIQNQFSSGVASSILLLFFMLTSTIFHSDAPDLLSIMDGGSNIIDSLGQLENPDVKFAPLYAIIIRLGQFIICYLCFGLVSLSDRRPILILIIIISFLLFLWCAFYPLGRGCSLPCVTSLRSVGFLVVTWTSIICYIRDSNSSNNDNEVSWTGYVGLGIVIACLWLLGIIFAYITQQKANKNWENIIKNSGLEEAIKELIQTADLILIEDAIGGGTIEGKTKRKELFIKEIQQTLTTSRLGQLLVRFEEKILAERLSYNFIQNRDEWRKSLLRNQTQSNNNNNNQNNRNSIDNNNNENNTSPILTFNDIIEHTRTLKNSIVPKAPIARINKHILATILENKLPEYVAWEVFKYLYDVEPIRQVLSPILTLTPEGKRPIKLTQIYERYYWWGEEAHAVTLLRASKRLLYQTIRENAPTIIPPSATTLHTNKKLNKITNRTSISKSNDNELFENIEMDRSIGLEWSCSACTLNNPNSKTICDACGKNRYN